MRAIRWAMSLAVMLASAPALGNPALSRWGHDDTPHADEVAGDAVSAWPTSALELETFQRAPNAAESGAFIDAFRGTSKASSVSRFDVRYANPGPPFDTELGIPLA